MPVLVGRGDRLITRSGRESWLSRPSTLLSAWAGGGMTRLAGGRSISYQGLYEGQHWVHTAVNKLNRQVARLPLKTYRLLEGNRFEGERERVRDHPLPRLLSSPAPRRSPVWLKQKVAHPALVHGNALLVKGVPSAGAAPDRLLPLDWRFITPHTDDAGEIIAWETSQPDRPQFLAPDSVIHVAWEGGAGDVGTSPLKALDVTLRSEDAATRYQASSFENGVRPSAVYVLPDGAEMDPQDKEQLRQMLQAQQGGVDRNFQLALVSGGGDIKTLQHTAVEAELIDQRKLNREEVAAAYDIPPPLIGILDKATYSNIDTQHQMLYTDVLGPWLVLIEETIQAQLVDTYAPWRDEGLFVEFDLAEVLRGDLLAEMQAIREGIGTGVLKPNEGRRIRNLPPEGDPTDPDNPANWLYMPSNNMTRMGSEPADPPANVDPVRSNLNRAADRVQRFGIDALNADRFERELGEDLDDTATAATWAGRVKQCHTADEIRDLADQ